MDYKKSNAPTNTVTRNMMELCEDTCVKTQAMYMKLLQ